MIVVFGGTGFIGGRLVKMLREQGKDVVTVTHRHDLAHHNGHRYGDFLSGDGLAACLRGAETVVQSTTFPGYPIENRRAGKTFEHYDAEGTERIVAFARQAGVRRYVYVAGAGVRPDSQRPYYQAIHRAETAVSLAGMEWASVRPAFVYGPCDKGLNTLMAAARKLPALPLVGGESKHQPVFVDDVALTLARLCPPGAPQGIFECGGPERMLMREMVAKAFVMAGLAFRPLVPVPKGLARFGGSVLERLPGSLLTASAIDFICENFLTDNKRMVTELGVQPTFFEDGLRTYLSPFAAPRAA